MRHFLVIGLGRFGRAVAESLAEAGGEVIALDTDMARVEPVRDRVAVAAQVESLEADALRAVGAADVDAAVVAIGEDFAAEVLTVSILKELGVKEIIARANSDREGRILERVGATRVVSVELEMGDRLARSLLAADVLDHVKLSDGVAMIYWTADERAVGHTLEDTELGSRWQLSVIGVIAAATGKLELVPPLTYVVQAGDVLLLAGADVRLAAFTK